jgi:DNA-binding LacI/PurR family transcriptional regulator
LSDFAFTNIFDGIESAALEAEQGLLVVGWDFMGKNLPSKREVLLHLLNDKIVDGVLIAFATIGEEFAPVLLSSRVPIVMVNRKAQLIGGSVTVQDTEAVKLAVNHLTSLGHSRIGYIGLEPGTTTAADRLEGFYSEMETKGLEVREEWMAVSASRDSDSQNTPLSAIIESSKLIGIPTALVVASVRPALLVISEMSERGIKVPLEMSVIAIGDNEFARITTPKLTTVWLPFEKMGRKSVEMLLDAVGGKELADVKLSDPPKIIQRDSTGAPRR